MKIKNRIENIKNNQNGLLLMELLIVIMIIGLLITGAVKTWDATVQQARMTQTLKELDQLAYAIAGNPELHSEGRRTDFGYVGDMGAIPQTLQDLVERPAGAVLWRGPYIRAKFTENPQDYMQDGWGNNYYYNRDSMIIRSYTTGSATTPQSWITKKIPYSQNSLLRNEVTGMVTDILNNLPEGHNNKLRVHITYPLNGDSWTQSTWPEEDGRYRLLNIPQGNHRMWCIYDSTPSTPDTTDLVQKYVCIYPGILNILDFRLTVSFPSLP